ncbi:MAG TPA: lysophospholipase [Stellaceae bacterium]|nr:lysophospholipase [Stellaceae bacterium]
MIRFCAAVRAGLLAALAVLSPLAACAPALPRQTESAAIPPHFAGDVFVTADGRRLPLRHWLPPGPPRAVILALHGFNDYSHAFAGPAVAWAEQGIATYAYDQRGFGAGFGRGRWWGVEALAADAVTASRILRRRYPGVPLYLLGESMGGAVAIVAATGAAGLPPADADGVVLAAPAVWGRATMRLLPRLLLWAAVRVAPNLTLTGRQLHILPSDNIAMLRALARDPLVIKATRVDAIWGLVNLMDAALAAAPRFKGPLLILYGRRDAIIPPAAIRRFVDGIRDPEARLAYYRQGYHMLLRDREAPRVIADVAHWIAMPAAPLLSGADRGARAALFGVERSAVRVPAGRANPRNRAPPARSARAEAD